MNKELEQEMDKWQAKAKTAIKYIAVDRSGMVYCFSSKPYNVSNYWIGGANICMGFTENKELIKNWDKSLRKVRYETAD